MPNRVAIRAVRSCCSTRMNQEPSLWALWMTGDNAR